MDCMQAKKNIFLYLDGLLSKEDAVELFAHLEQCCICQDYMKEAQAVDALLHENLPMIDPPAGFSTRVMTALPPESAKIIPFTRRFSWPAKFGTIAAALAIVVGVALANPFGGNVVQPGGNDPNHSSINVGQNQPVPDQPAVSPPDDTTNPGSQGTQTGITSTPADTQKPASQPKDTPITTTGDATEAPASDDKNGTNDTAGQEPATPTESGEISLPKAAYGAVGIGRFEMRLIASHEGVNILSPLANEKTKLVNYFVQVDGKTQLWQVNFEDNVEPTFVAAFDSMEDAKATITQNENLKKADAAINQEGISAFSPDGSIMAAFVNGEDEPGLWLAGISNTQEPWRIFDKQCGSILSWAPNSGKLIFTDNQGCLYVAYPAENMVLPIATGTVSQLIWVDRGNTIIFLMCPEGSQYYGLYVAQLP